jgi:DNA (cytosine-5)-methyltransferase 1
VEEVYGARTLWHAEIDPNVSRVLAARWPDARNLGDVSSIGASDQLFAEQWSDLPPVKILTGGFPCQDISRAGNGAGITEGTRSGLWHVMAQAIRHLRPRLVVVENVALLRSRGLDVVLGHLAALGYDAQWCSLRASDVGAPHQRDRVFLTAHPAPDPSGERHGRGQDPRVVGRMGTAPEGGGRVPGPAREVPLDRAPEAWGPYADAVARWETTIGRPAPDPVDETGDHSAVFVEWMMGLPSGWVTDVLDRKPALKALGNGVVPQQAAAALRILDNLQGAAA